jgi:hypothetical protein
MARKGHNNTQNANDSVQDETTGTAVPSNEEKGSQVKGSLDLSFWGGSTAKQLNQQAEENSKTSTGKIVAVTSGAIIVAIIVVGLLTGFLQDAFKSLADLTGLDFFSRLSDIPSLRHRRIRTVYKMENDQFITEKELLDSFQNKTRKNWEISANGVPIANGPLKSYSCIGVLSMRVGDTKVVVSDIDPVEGLMKMKFKGFTLDGQEVSIESVDYRRVIDAA